MKIGGTLIVWGLVILGLGSALCRPPFKPGQEETDKANGLWSKSLGSLTVVIGMIVFVAGMLA